MKTRHNISKPEVATAIVKTHEIMDYKQMCVGEETETSPEHGVEGWEGAVLISPSALQRGTCFGDMSSISPG